MCLSRTSAVWVCHQRVVSESSKSSETLNAVRSMRKGLLPMLLCGMDIHCCLVSIGKRSRQRDDFKLPSHAERDCIEMRQEFATSTGFAAPTVSIGFALYRNYSPRGHRGSIAGFFSGLFGLSTLNGPPSGFTPVETRFDDYHLSS